MSFGSKNTDLLYKLGLIGEGENSLPNYFNQKCLPFLSKHGSLSKDRSRPYQLNISSNYQSVNPHTSLKNSENLFENDHIIKNNDFISPVSRYSLILNMVPRVYEDVDTRFIKYFYPYPISTTKRSGGRFYKPLTHPGMAKIFSHPDSIVRLRVTQGAVLPKDIPIAFNCGSIDVIHS